MTTLNYKRTLKPFPAEALPEVIVDAHPEFIALNQVAWRQAWDHVRETSVLPGSPFMSEGCEVNKVWIWDSCFMGMFCRYAIGAFPQTSLSECCGICMPISPRKMLSRAASSRRWT